MQGSPLSCLAAQRRGAAPSSDPLWGIYSYGSVSISEWVTGGQKPAKSAGSSRAREAGAARSTPRTQAVVHSTRLPCRRDHARLQASPVPADVQNMHHKSTESEKELWA